MADALLEIPYRDPMAAFAPFRDEPHALLLLGAAGRPRGRWSLAAVRPVRTLSIDALAPRTAFEAAIRSLIGAPGPSGPLPFRSGAAGFISYEAGAMLEACAPQRRPDGIPLAALARYDAVAAFDEDAKRAYVAASTPAEARRLADALGGAAGPLHAGGGAVAPEPPDRFLDQVASVRAAIRRGDVFQVNVSRLYAGRLGRGDHPFDLFRRLAHASPAPFAAYLRLPGAAIVSNAPERLASVRPGPDGRLLAETSPIKGTRPRGRDAAQDRALRAELASSVKDRAENLMIVDLMRSDLSRVCRVGSVRAPALFEIESFANVHHLVSSVEGVLSCGRDAVDLIAATFPAGSITGAPKLMAMQIIDRLEAAPRGASYGGIGWFDDSGAMDLSVTIRTAACIADGREWRVDFRAGCGITIDSDPLEELAEAEAKAARLIAAVEGDVR